MQYFKKTELANTYHVSVRAVANWVEAAQKGKLDLALIEHSGKQYVANTAGNLSKIEKMVEARRKYRTTKAYKIISPKPEFYTIYEPDQVLDIISNLESDHEIPRQYNYFRNGADYWDEYASRLSKEDNDNILLSTVSLLELNTAFLDELLSKYKYINVVDVGPGNGLPVKGLLQRLHSVGRLKRYVAIDISPDIIAIAENNIKTWFNGEVEFEGELRDITHERFADILAFDNFGVGSDTVNLVLFLGATLVNLRNPEEALDVIRHSLSLNDILIYSTGLDNPAPIKYIYHKTSAEKSKLPSNHRFAMDVMNIDESLYDVEYGFDLLGRMRFICAKFKVAISLNFQGVNGVREVVFKKDDKILLWRAWHKTALQTLGQFEAAGFKTVQASISRNDEFLLSIHKVRTAANQ